MRKCGFHKDHDDNCNTCNYSLAMNLKESAEDMLTALDLAQAYIRRKNVYDVTIILDIIDKAIEKSPIQLEKI